MDLIKFLVSASSENKLVRAAWRSGSKLLRDYGQLMRKEHHTDVRFSRFPLQSACLFVSFCAKRITRTCVSIWLTV